MCGNGAFFACIQWVSFSPHFSVLVFNLRTARNIIKLS
ncbi:hypothetical protein GKA53_04125 [Vibrio parahaemolyticus]|nr:hypothetical protein [Vibrio parahaemolyticus]EGQ8849891.1 hypothetical protein [Vibrio parahaemolyticus]EGQ8854082.1 hypothetical protein [Vibrio parahaemolyticus]EGQ8873328.1 hypothetical protein [Vibrio parahaemolyticus]EGQ8993042.1 hypothetical protein [Vibrio parahaemolyticus]